MTKAMAVGRKNKRKSVPREGGMKGKQSKVLLFRSIKRVLFGKSRKRSMDLLDKWILKKNPLGLFL